MLHIEFFQRRIGDTVRIAHGADKIRANVAEVQPLDSKDSDRRQPFAVLLEAPTIPTLAKGIYTVLFDHGEHHDLYVVPAGPRDDRALYKLIFS